MKDTPEYWEQYLPNPEEHAREVWEWFRDMMDEDTREGTSEPSRSCSRCGSGVGPFIDGVCTYCKVRGHG